MTSGREAYHHSEINRPDRLNQANVFLNDGGSFTMTLSRLRPPLGSGLVFGQKTKEYYAVLFNVAGCLGPTLCSRSFLLPCLARIRAIKKGEGRESGQGGDQGATQPQFLLMGRSSSAFPANRPGWHPIGFKVVQDRKGLIPWPF